MVTPKQNGRWTLANTIISIGVAALLGITAWLLNTAVETREFMSRGDRCTAHECRQIQSHIERDNERMKHIEENIAALPPRWLSDMVEDLKVELRRQQLQIDRLEGHDPRNYTEDQAWIDSETSPPTSSLP